MRIELNIPDYIKFLPAEKRVDTLPFEDGEYKFTKEAPEAINFIKLKCQHCGVGYRIFSENTMWVYNNRLMFHSYCTNCEKYTVAVIGEVVFE